LLNGGNTGVIARPVLRASTTTTGSETRTFATYSISAAATSFLLEKARSSFRKPAAWKSGSGGWAVVWLTTLQGGQPITIGCPEPVSTAVGCDALKVAGQDPQLGLHSVLVDPNDPTKGHLLSWIGNPGAFTQPCKLGAGGVPIAATLGNGQACVPLTGTAALGGAPTQIVGPGLHRLDFSLFKKFPITERISMEFRSEFFNLTNHPNFHSPSDRNFEDGNRFGQITSTRQSATNPRQIQFALKLYY